MDQAPQFAVTPSAVVRGSRGRRPVVGGRISVGQPFELRLAIFAAEQLGRALYAPLFESREQPPNSARFTFLDPAAQTFFVDWEKAAKDLVAAAHDRRARLGRARWPAATPTTARSQSSLASYRPAATRSASGGRRTTCGITRPAPSDWVGPAERRDRPRGCTPLRSFVAELELADVPADCCPASTRVAGLTFTLQWATGNMNVLTLAMAGGQS